MSIVVPATSGHLGRLIVTDLLDRGVPAGDIVAGARNLDAITDLAEASVRTTVIDYDDPSTVEAALSPGDAFVLISGKDLANRRRQHADAIAAATRARVGHVVYTSGLRAAESPSPIAASHAPTEDDVRASGLPFTILRNGWYTRELRRHHPRGTRDRGPARQRRRGPGRLGHAPRLRLSRRRGRHLRESPRSDLRAVR